MISLVLGKSAPSENAAGIAEKIRVSDLEVGRLVGLVRQAGITIAAGNHGMIAAADQEARKLLTVIGSLIVTRDAASNRTNAPGYTAPASGISKAITNCNAAIAARAKQLASIKDCCSEPLRLLLDAIPPTAQAEGKYLTMAVLAHMGVTNVEQHQCWTWRMSPMHLTPCAASRWTSPNCSATVLTLQMPSQHGYDASWLRTTNWWRS